MSENPRDNPLDIHPVLRRPTPEASGLKTVTVFVIVLLFHVTGIVGFLVWQYNHPGNQDANIANLNGSVQTPPADGTTTPDSNATGNQTTPTTTGTDSTTSTNTDTPSAPTGDSSNLATPNNGTPSPAPAVQPVVMPNTNSALAQNDVPPSPAPQQVQAPAPPVPISQAPVPDTTASITPAPTPVTPPAPTSPTDLAGTNPPTEPGAITYTVKKGDSLAKIARRHHTTLSKLRSANDLGTSDSVTIGEKIIIPPKASAIKPTPKPILTAATSTTPNPGTNTNGATTPTSTTPFAPNADNTPSVPTPAPMKSYTVAHHDTMTRIAHKFHITTAALIAANPQVTNAASLHIGDELNVPPPKPKVTPTHHPVPTTN